MLLQHREYPGSNNGTGLFQVLTGLKMRSTYERLTAKRNSSKGLDRWLCKFFRAHGASLFLTVCKILAY